MAISRVIRREMLDYLPAGDPLAVRAREDLRMINALMGNTRWVRSALRRATQRSRGWHANGDHHFVELGAGDGRLCRKLSNWFPGSKVLGLDLAPRPGRLPEAISWEQGDLLTKLPHCTGEVLVGVMILHHFADKRLSELSTMLGNYRVLCFCEPWRSRFAHGLGLLVRPLLGRVTRHDLPASIDAGFVAGELPALFGLGAWRLEESVDWRGSVRLLAWKE